MKSYLLLVLLVPVAAGAVSVADVAFTEEANRDVTVSYTLNEPAVVTFDVTTNGASIGGRHLWNVSGDVNRLILPEAADTPKDCSFTWCPTHEAAARLFRGTELKIVVSAWPTNDPPDYMVVSILTNVAPRVRYYATAESVPGGVLDPLYRTSSILMRKIPAKDVTWTMGSGSGELKADSTDPNREVTHTMRFPRNYYMGVFEVTRLQWYWLRSGNYSAVGTHALLPMDQISFLDARENPSNQPNDNYVYPKPPNPDTFMGLLRTRTGVDFDLPSESWWEYAARGTWGDATWGDGSAMSGAATDDNLARMANFKQNSGGKLALCGSFAPNDFGLYDMSGNVFEWCLDWGYTARHTRNDLADGSVQTTLYDTSNPVHLLRGGGYDTEARYCRPARRAWAKRDVRAAAYGLRLACPADAK